MCRFNPEVKDIYKQKHISPRGKISLPGEFHAGVK